MSIFTKNRYEEVENKVKALLSGQKTFLSSSTVGSTRAIGDAIENII
jgi:hypothetical protein